MRSARQQLRADRAIRRANRDFCECGNPNPLRSPWGCSECQRIERERKEADSTAAAVLRAVRNDEGLCAVEIAAVAGVTIEECSAALSWLKERGVVESCMEKGFGMVYRLKQRRAA
jgi:DNA-binding transcriptional ArsR family regulator